MESAKDKSAPRNGLERMSADVPPELRERIDRDIAEKPKGRTTRAAVHRHYRLHEDYGVDLRSFYEYARRTNHRKRKEAIGRITTPLVVPTQDDDPEKLQGHGHLLLVQRIIRTLEEGELTTSELARMATAFTAQYKLGLEREKNERAKQAEAVLTGRSSTAKHVIELVREIYGAEVSADRVSRRLPVEEPPPVHGACADTAS